MLAIVRVFAVFDEESLMRGSYDEPVKLPSRRNRLEIAHRAYVISVGRETEHSRTRTYPGHIGATTRSRRVDYLQQLDMQLYDSNIEFWYV